MNVVALVSHLIELGLAKQDVLDLILAKSKFELHYL